MVKFSLYFNRRVFVMSQALFPQLGDHNDKQNPVILVLQNLVIFTRTGLCRVVAVNYLSVLHYNVVYIFKPLVVTEPRIWNWNCSCSWNCIRIGADAVPV